MHTRKSLFHNDFYPRSPCGERLFVGLLRTFASLFLSTLSLRRATIKQAYFDKRMRISIHALLAESDPFVTEVNSICHNFYPRSPCGERLPLSAALCGLIIFLSTLSLRRATVKPILGKINTRDFYPRSPCGERPVMYNIVFMAGEFLSTLSLRRATEISENRHMQTFYFYPRSPCGERQPTLLIRFSPAIFLSTLSLRRATSPPRITPTPSRNFYPRSPCGERLERCSFEEFRK